MLFCVCHVRKFSCYNLLVTEQMQHLLIISKYHEVCETILYRSDKSFIEKVFNMFISIDAKPLLLQVKILAKLSSNVVRIKYLQPGWRIIFVTNTIFTAVEMIRWNQLLNFIIIKYWRYLILFNCCKHCRRLYRNEHSFCDRSLNTRCMQLKETTSKEVYESISTTVQTAKKDSLRSVSANPHQCAPDPWTWGRRVCPGNRRRCLLPGSPRRCCRLRKWSRAYCWGPAWNPRVLSPILPAYYCGSLNLDTGDDVDTRWDGSGRWMGEWSIKISLVLGTNM